MKNLPSSITHSYFALDVYQKLPSFYQDRIQSNLEDFKLYAQGSDPFMFYHFFLTKTGSRIQSKMHKENTQDFFIHTIQYIYENDLYHNPEIMSYLYGHICHYFLDVNTHPFIYYKAGVFDPRKKETYKYNALHQKIEYRIDSYFIEKREQIPPQKFQVDKFIFENYTFSKEIMNLIRASIGKPYQIPNVVSLYKTSIKDMKKFFRWVNYDPYGFKLKIYQILDAILPNFVVRLEELSYYTPYSENQDYLNLEHKTWNLPWNKNKKFQTSFLDLYEIAIIQACDAIKEVTLMLEQKKLNQKRLQEIFKNLSYSTGLDCKKRVKMKYFEF